MKNSKISVPRYGFKFLSQRYIRGVCTPKTEVFEFKNSLFLNSASSCIAFYLMSISVEKKLRVGVPIFICSSVLEAIKSAGHEIVFLDIEISKQGYIFDEHNLKNLDAIIFVHFFGYKFKNIIDIKNKYTNIIVIEDCSHLSYNIYHAKIDGDAGVFSFNFHKPMPIGTGGALVIPQHSSFIKFLNLYSFVRTQSIASDFRKFIYITVKDAIFLPDVYNFLKGILNKKRSVGTSLYVPKKIQILKPPRFFWSFMKYYSRANVSNKKNCDSYLGISKEFRLNCTVSEANNLLYFPIFCRNEQQKMNLISELKLIGVEAFLLWENFLNNATKFSISFDTNKFKSAKIFTEKIFFLPQDLFTNEKYSYLLSRTIEIVNQGEFNS